MLAELALALTLALAPSPAPPAAYVPIAAASMHQQAAATVTGRIVAMPDHWRWCYVWLAPFVPFEDGGDSGYYILDPSIMPQATMMPGGLFVFTDVTPGRYCALAGPSPEEAEPSRNEWGLAAVYDVRGHGITNLGSFAVWESSN
jgi:hypothetical protein